MREGLLMMTGLFADVAALPDARRQ
jgi:hypothetical protein